MSGWFWTGGWEPGEGAQPLREQDAVGVIKMARRIRVRRMSPEGHRTQVLSKKRAFWEASKAILCGLMVYVEPQRRLVTSVAVLRREIGSVEAMLIVYPATGG